MSSFTAATVGRIRMALGLLLGLGIGALCRFLDIPSPAPPVLPGALLVVAMTLGYLITDRWLSRRHARRAAFGAGCDGNPRSEAKRVDSAM